jgi:hypothetical protein
LGIAGTAKNLLILVGVTSGSPVISIPSMLLLSQNNASGSVVFHGGEVSAAYFGGASHAQGTYYDYGTGKSGSFVTHGQLIGMQAGAGGFVGVAQSMGAFQGESFAINIGPLGININENGISSTFNWSLGISDWGFSAGLTNTTTTEIK